MDLVQIIILAIVQGITEFLPVSSSAHLILVPLLTEWQDQGLAIDVAAHLGSLFAVVLYFRTDVYQLSLAGYRSCTLRQMKTTDQKLFWWIVIASLPVLVIGFLTHDVVANYLRDPLVIAAASIVFGLFLWFADSYSRRELKMTDMTLKNAIFIGLFQVIALIPGASRSGITMSAGMLIGMDRMTAARFSFLLSMPVILFAAAYESLQLLQLGVGIDVINFLLTAICSALSALLAIHYFLKFLERIGLLPFVIYRIILGIVLLALFV